jgi:hypothetical protein
MAPAAPITTIKTYTITIYVTPSLMPCRIGRAPGGTRNGSAARAGLTRKQIDEIVRFFSGYRTS